MIKIFSGTKIEIWSADYINFPSMREDETDEGKQVIQAEPAGIDGMFIVEVGRDLDMTELML